MQRWLDRLATLRGQVFLYNVLFVGGILAVFALTFFPLRVLLVGGTHFHGIVTSKDLVAAVQPTPLYVVEAELLVMRLAQEYDEAKRTELVGALDAQRERFEKSAKAWSDQLDDPALRAALTAAL